MLLCVSFGLVGKWWKIVASWLEKRSQCLRATVFILPFAALTVYHYDFLTLIFMLPFVYLAPTMCRKNKGRHFFVLGLTLLTVGIFLSLLAVGMHFFDRSNTTLLTTYTGVDKTIALLKQENFPLDRVYVTSQLNAFYTSGFFIKEFIMVGERFVKELSQEQLAAVIGHELGHRVNKDGLKRLSLTLLPFILRAPVLVYLIAPTLESLSSFTVPLFQAFGFETEPMAGAYAIYHVLSLVTDSVWQKIINWMTRQGEYNADLHAKKLGLGTELVPALTWLHNEMQRNIDVQPMFGSFYLSHPSLVERIEGLEK